MDFIRIITPLGEMLLVGSHTALIGAWFMGQKHFPPIPPQRIASSPLLPSGKHSGRSTFPFLAEAAGQLDAYFSGKLRTFDLPFAPVGTPFQESVWQALLTIPYGETRSYSDMAEASGHARAVRATGAAIGKNPLTIFIPCHRVVGKKGALTGYAGGLDRKRALLTIESATE